MQLFIQGVQEGLLTFFGNFSTIFIFYFKFANLNMIHDKGIEETKIATNFREKRKRIERSEVKLKKNYS